MRTELLIKREWGFFVFSVSEGSRIFKARSSCRTLGMVCHVVVTTGMLYLFSLALPHIICT